MCVAYISRSRLDSNLYQLQLVLALAFARKRIQLALLSYAELHPYVLCRRGQSALLQGQEPSKGRACPATPGQPAPLPSRPVLLAGWAAPRQLPHAFALLGSPTAAAGPTSWVAGARGQHGSVRGMGSRGGCGREA